MDHPKTSSFTYLKPEETNNKRTAVREGRTERGRGGI